MDMDQIVIGSARPTSDEELAKRGGYELGFRPGEPAPFVLTQNGEVAACFQHSIARWRWLQWKVEGL